MPPRFGVSSAPACGTDVSASAANATKNRHPRPMEFLPIASVCLVAARVYLSRREAGERPCRRSPTPEPARRRAAAPDRRAALLVEPDRRQILIQEMARADLPALDVG